jgi:hypothetical protein
MKRKHSAPSVSFFAFQDIITSVVGIFVLIAITMVVQLVDRQTEAASNPSLPTAQLLATREHLREQIQQLEQRFSTLTQRQSSSLAVNRFSAAAIEEELNTEHIRIEAAIQRSRELIQRVQDALEEAEKDRRQLIDKTNRQRPLRQELEQLEKRIRQADLKLEKLLSDNPLVYRNTSLGGRSLILFDIDEKEIRILDLASEKSDSLLSMTQLENRLASYPVQNFHFLLMVRPTGVSRFDSLRKLLEDRGASYGFDVLDAGKSISMASELEPMP